MIGVVDWGVGGVWTATALRQRLGPVAMTYLSDSGSIPYGKLGPKHLARRLAKVCRWLGVERVVVACNAASTALDALSPALAGSDAGTELHGVIAPGVRAALESGGQTIGVIGGHRTIASGLYQAQLKAAGRRVVAQVAQPLSAHVEAGRLVGGDVEDSVARIMAPLARQAVDCVVLACTHYPALRGLIQRQVPDASLIDPAQRLVDELAVAWRDPSRQPGDARFFTTGDAHQMRTSAQKAFGVTLEGIVELPPCL